MFLRRRTWLRYGEPRRARTLWTSGDGWPCGCQHLAGGALPLDRLAQRRHEQERRVRDLYPRDDSLEHQVPGLRGHVHAARLLDSNQHDTDCVLEITAAEFVGRLATVLAHLMLRPHDRGDALRQFWRFYLTGST